MLAISTAWNHKPNVRMETMLDEIKGLGLDAIELGYKLTVSELEELIPLLEKKKMRVSSIHNFCPVPNDGPSSRHPSNYYLLSSLEENERRKAVEWTHKTIDTALRVGSRVVVIHAGTIDWDHDPVSMIKAYKTGQADSKEFARARQEVLTQRKKNKALFWEAVVKSLDQVVLYGHQKNVKIGLETRYYPTEIPNFEEIGELLDRYSPEDMGYWHDVGHGEVNVRLGLVPSHRHYFDCYQKRLIGMHIHGVVGIKDHQAPFTGDFDLKGIMPYLQDGVIRVIESHPVAGTEEIKEAVRRLRGH